MARPRRTTNPPPPAQMSAAAIEQLVAQRVTAALAQYDAGRTGSSGGSHGTGGGIQPSKSITIITTTNQYHLT